MVVSFYLSDFGFLGFHGEKILKIVARIEIINLTLSQKKNIGIPNLYKFRVRAEGC